MPRLGRTRPASDYRHIQPVSQIALAAHGLTVDNLQLAAPLLTPSAGATVSLTTPNLALATPLLAPGIGPSLTTPNLQLAAPALLGYQAVPLTPSPFIPMPIAGFGYQQDDIINLWSNAAAFFQQRVIFTAAESTTPTTLPHAGTITVIGFDAISEDPYGGWDGVSQWISPLSGWYQVTLRVWVTAPGAINTVLRTYVQTAKAPGNAAQGQPLTSTVIPNDVAGGEGTWYVYLAAGDGVSVAASIGNSASDVTTDLAAGQNPTMEVVWISS